MNVQLAQIEIIEMLINTQKPTVLKQVKALLEEDKSMLSAEDYKIIKERRERRRRGESESYTWEETKAMIRNSKKTS